MARAEAGDAEARSRHFLADAAHHLRTPTAGIQVAAQNLLRGVDPEDQTRLLADVVRETARATRLITCLLHIARLDEGQPLTFAPTDLVELCADEVDRASSLAPHLDFVLRAEERAGQPDLDAGAISEVLANLLDNARRFAVAKVEVLIGPLEGGVRVGVVDDGAGVPAGMEERIFERFVSAGHRAGAGLGLAIGRTFMLRVPVARWSGNEADPAG